MKVGQTLWFVPTRGFGEPREVTVTKVGRRWAVVDRGRLRIDIKTGRAEDKGYSSPGRCYYDKETWEKKRAADMAWFNFRIWIGWVSSIPEGVSIEDIQRAAGLLKMPMERGRG